MDYDCQHFHRPKLTNQIKKWMLTRTSAIYRQKEKRGSSHLLIELNLRKTFSVLIRTVATKEHHILGMKVNKYLLCADKNFHKKVKPLPSNERVVYINLTYKRKMLFSRCKKIRSSSHWYLTTTMDRSLLLQMQVVVFLPNFVLSSLWMWEN